MAYHSALREADFHPETRAFFRGQRVAVLGGGGFIGSHVVEALLALGASVVSVGRRATPPFLAALGDRIERRTADLAAPGAAAAAMAGCPIVLHVAAAVAGLEYNAQHPASIFADNLRPFMNSLEAAAQAKVTRFLVTSTACVYPRHCSVPTPEAEGTRDAPEPTNEGYGWAKRMEEFLARAAAAEYGLSVAVARPYNAYGPRDNFDPASSHVLPALIRKALLASQRGEAHFPVWGDGSHSRSFLYVDDFARGLLEVAARHANPEPLNIGAASETTIGEAARLVGELVSAATGRAVSPQFNPAGLTGQPRRAPDLQLVEARLGYQAQVALRVGLAATLDWYLQQPSPKEIAA